MARDHLRKRREALGGLSQAAVAKRAGLKPSEYSRIECGYMDVSSASASAIGAALGIAPAHVDQGPPPLPHGLAAAARAQAVTAAPFAEKIPTVTAPTSPAAFPYSSAPVIVDPASFSEQPNARWLDQDGADSETHRKRLTDALNYATVILHTSRVPAKVWAAWRQFEKRAAEAQKKIQSH